jgi:serine/threonine protein phosphatase PrpC
MYSGAGHSPAALAAVSGESRPGPGRDRNDDRWVAAGGNGTLLVAVADGMGATAGGGTAATIALRAVLDVLTAAPPVTPSTAGWAWDDEAARGPAGSSTGAGSGASEVGSGGDVVSRGTSGAASRAVGSGASAVGSGGDAASRGTSGAASGTGAVGSGASATGSGGDAPAQGGTAADSGTEPAGTATGTLASAMACAQRRVRAAVPPGVPEVIRPGTTLTAVLVCGDRMDLAHAGDSSCWLHRFGRLRRLTDVHTSAAVLVAAGAVDRDSAAARRLDNLLTRYIGMPGPLEPQLCALRLRAGDRVLLASDGLTRAVPAPLLALLLAGSTTDAADLVAAAVAHGGTDDVTAVLVTVSADYPASAEVADVAESRAAPAGGTEVGAPSATSGLPAASLPGG